MKVSIAILLCLLISSLVYCQDSTPKPPVVASVSEQSAQKTTEQVTELESQDDSQIEEQVKTQTKQVEKKTEDSNGNSAASTTEQIPDKNLKAEDSLEEQESIQEKVTKIDQPSKTSTSKAQEKTPKSEVKSIQTPKQVEPTKTTQPDQPTQPKPVEPVPSTSEPVKPIKKLEEKPVKLEQNPKKLEQKTTKPVQKPEQKSSTSQPKEVPKQDKKVQQPKQETKVEQPNPSLQAPVDTTKFQVDKQPKPAVVQQKTAATNPRPNPTGNQFPIPEDKNTPFYCGRATFMRGAQARTRLEPQQGDQLVKTNYGFDMYINSLDFSVANIIAISGTWQPQYINLIGHIVKSGDTVLNVGVQSGLMALVMGKIVGEKGKLYAVEPYATQYDLFNKNIQLNGLKPITTVYKKLSTDVKSNGTVVLQGQMGRRFPFMNPGMNMVPPGFMNPTQGPTGRPTKPGQAPTPDQLMLNRTVPNPFIQQSQKVQADLIDNILPANTKVDFALIDVQKNEIKTLRGMKKTIENSPNLVMMVQWQFASNRQSNKQQAKQVIDYILSKGFKIYTYSGGNIVTCQIGAFHQFKDVQNLFRINRISVFFFPSTVQLPK